MLNLSFKNRQMNMTVNSGTFASINGIFMPKISYSSPASVIKP